MWPYTDDEANWLLIVPAKAAEDEGAPIFDDFEAFALWNGA